MRRPTERAPARVSLTALLLLAWVGGCTGPAPTSQGGETIPRELFVEVIVDLRMEGLRRPSGYLVRGEGDPILRRHGVSEADLRTFIDVHARDIPYMNEVWSEIERRILGPDETPPALDTGAP